MQEFFSFGNQFYFYFVSVEWQGKIKAKISKVLGVGYAHKKLQAIVNF